MRAKAISQCNSSNIQILLTSHRQDRWSGGEWGGVYNPPSPTSLLHLRKAHPRRTRKTETTMKSKNDINLGPMPDDGVVNNLTRDAAGKDAARTIMQMGDEDNWIMNRLIDASHRDQGYGWEIRNGVVQLMRIPGQPGFGITLPECQLGISGGDPVMCAEMLRDQAETQISLLRDAVKHLNRIVRKSKRNRRDS